MEIFGIIIFIFVGIIAHTNGIRQEVGKNIVNGQPSRMGQFPSLVLIDTPNKRPCLGTIVESRHVVTSAQCALDGSGKVNNPFWYKITTGDINLAQPTSRRITRNVSQFFVHSGFNPSTKNNDIAVLRLDEAFPDPHNTIEVVERITRPLPPDQVCQFAGWNFFNGQQLFFQALVRSRIDCNTRNQHNGKILDNMICAKNNDPKYAPCPDSIGGGLFCGRRLAGILSFGATCSESPVFEVYTNVQKYNSWINDQFGRADFTEPGTLFK